MKNIIILFFLILINYAGFAQRNFYKLNIGVGAGFTRAYTDYDIVKREFAQNGVLDYYFTPYSSLGIEFQRGNLNGGEINGKNFENQYLALSGNAKVNFGEFLPFSYTQTFLKKVIKGVYLGAGLGVIKNKVSDYPDNDLLITKEIIVPLNVGIDIHLSNKSAEHSFSINLNAQSAYTLGDNLDGEFIRTNTKNDRYNFFSVGLRYSFGFKGYYPKGWTR